jgi:hypothetical protein
MAVVIPNDIAQRISQLAQKNNRNFYDQLKVMTETFEIMDIQKVSTLPHPVGGQKVPVVEVSQVRRG